jgi:pSer/pThr/pTyr-binding forkhead associated (FHA) protein
MWKLVIEDDEGKRTVVPLTRDDYTIGRKDGNTIRLTERNVSRDHAKLSKKAMNGGGEPALANIAHANGGGGYVLEDLTSYNGVYVNGLRVAHAQDLTHGDLIQIGDYRIVLQNDAVADVGVPAVSGVPGLPGSPDVKQTMPSGTAQRASLLMERPNRLVMLAGPTPGAEYPLDVERLSIGRAEDAGISVNHNSVSRLHCEVHALGDGRYEIVDKGSSNGVRVNAAELRRGIIEAGDVIELGDVKFKFVGAGQIFRPGATDSQQLAAIGERAADEIVGKRRSSNALPIVLFGAIVVIGAGGAWFFTRPKPEPTPSPTAAISAESPEATLLTDAKKLCAAGNCDAAHDKLAKIPDGSPLRNDADFKGIEIKWAQSVLDRAQNEADVTRKRAMLQQVSNALTADPAQRKTAADLLQALADMPSSDPNQLPIATTRDAGTKYDAGALKYDAGARPVYDAGATAATASTARPLPTSTDLEKEGQLALTQRDMAKKSLEGKVYSGRASTDEIRLLKSLCKEVGDRNCVEMCRKMLDKPAP